MRRKVESDIPEDGCWMSGKLNWSLMMTERNKVQVSIADDTLMVNPCCCR